MSISGTCAAEQFIANCTFHSLQQNWFITTFDFSPMFVSVCPVLKLFSTDRTAELSGLPIFNHFT